MLLASGASQCTPPQPSGNPLLARVNASSDNPSSSQAGRSGDTADPSEIEAGPSEPLDAKAKLRDKNKQAQKRFRERKKASYLLHTLSCQYMSSDWQYLPILWQIFDELPFFDCGTFHAVYCHNSHL